MSDPTTMQQRVVQLEELVREQELTIRRAKAETAHAHQRARLLARQLKALKRPPNRK